MEPLFFAAIIGPASVAGGVFVAALTGATFEMGYPSEVKSR